MNKESIVTSEVIGIMYERETQRFYIVGPNTKTAPEACEMGPDRIITAAIILYCRTMTALGCSSDAMMERFRAGIMMCEDQRIKAEDDKKKAKAKEAK